MKIKHTLLFLISYLILIGNIFGQIILSNDSEIDLELLNTHILNEVNLLRQTAKTPPLSNQILLKPASEDHASYMLDHEKTTHFQKNKIKKTPQNRVNFYGEQFSLIGENIQMTYISLCFEKKSKRQKKGIVTYESLAKELVLNWRNSPKHYKNIIFPDYKTTFTSIKMTKDGKIYACQLLGSTPYNYPIPSPKIYPYKPEKNCKCRRANKKTLLGTDGRVIVLKDSTLVYVSNSKRRAIKGIVNPWSDGMAADIVLKSQYPCNGENTFNAKRGVRGVPLEPVFKKDFRKGKNYVNKQGFTSIELGKLPSWVTEDYEINITIINKKRTCKNIKVDITPVDFHLNLPLEFSFDTLMRKLHNTYYDTVSCKIYYEKATSLINDSSLKPIIKMIEENQSKIVEIKVKGFASIEGSAALNTKLYNKRAQIIIDYLKKYGVDTAKIIVSTNENFEEFRRDVKNTPFEFLHKLSNNNLKKKLSEKELSRNLEYILKNHRYAELTLNLRKDEIINYDKKLTHELLQKSIDNNKINEAKSLQSVQFGLALKGEIKSDDLDSVTIPEEKRNVDLLNNKILMKYFLDSLNPNSSFNLKQSLLQLYAIDSNNKVVNTNLKLLEYREASKSDLLTQKKFYQLLVKKTNIDSKIKARMILNLGANHDWNLYYSRGISKRVKYLYNKSKSYIKEAKLTPEQTFDLAGYYAFFNDVKFSYQLTKNLLDKTERLKDLLFFLKLIHPTDVDISKKTYYSLFRKIQRISGDEFCTLFNSPNLNFQILDDLEIKKIYCNQCSDYEEKEKTPMIKPEY